MSFDPLEKLGPVVIEGDGDLSRVCDLVEDLLSHHDGLIFQRGGVLCRVVEGGSRIGGLSRDPAAPRIVQLDDLSFCDLATRRIEFQRRNRKTMHLVACDCPRNVAQTILSRKEWDFPTLRVVVEHPIMLPTGQVLWEDQFHVETGVLLKLPFCEFQTPVDHPSDHDLQASLELLLGLLDGFDFVSDTDKSVALAFLMTPFVRAAIPTAPGFAISAHAAGSGKSTLGRIAARMSTGRDPAFMTFRDDPVELAKIIFAALLEGDQQIAIDNIDVPVSGAELAVILTSPMYRGRVLGQSATATVPTNVVLSMNGNNLEIRGDLTRRVVVIQLDPSCENPAERVFDSDPIQEVTDCRSAYVNAALTIMAGYISSGERVDVRPFGSFEEWSRLVREPLVWLGLPDPVDSIRTLEAADPERTQLNAMLQTVSAAYGTREFKAGELVTAASAKQQQRTLDGGVVLTVEQATALREALQAVCERNGELSHKALGRWLERVKGRIGSGLKFEKTRQVGGSTMWRASTSEGWGL